MTKYILIVQNNANIYAVIDINGKELVPFSYGIKQFNRNTDSGLYEDVMKAEGISYVYTSSNGEKTAEHLDLKTMKIESDILIQEHYNAFRHRYECEAGTFYINDGIFDEGIIPVLREDKAGYTFAIVTR